MLSTIATSLLLASAATYAQSTTSYPADVIASGTMGTTNPPQPTLGTSINQTSDARLLSVNGIDDWCIFAPPEMQVIADSETYEIAWCSQARNDARVIPDGTVTGVSLLKTDMYVQIMGYGNLTALNIPYGDYGGELDPHGAYGSGNPIGGNVTTNVTVDGQTINVAEWMLYVSYEMFCCNFIFLFFPWSFVLTSSSPQSAPVRGVMKPIRQPRCVGVCLIFFFFETSVADIRKSVDELDEMGCQFVMPGNYDFNGTFETCEADVAYPPGWYVEGSSGGTTSFSSFAQYWTGVVDGTTYTAGDTATPSTVQSTPSSSNCQTVPTISNGIALASLGVSGASLSTASATGSAVIAGVTGTSQSSPSSSGSSNSAVVTRPGIQGGLSEGITLVSMIAAVVAIGIFH
ncbi:hypothetical protein D9757_008823 [Collybiopsis confluens]|uniref:Uncharacterized protein n=1 Tax=Collybiopsis confluens TaxID=2823264 RepID=A0A8H5M069_9AGAR|nr:hypothetical protein D9757_008823 [Collybiopsis confluens]